ncbi:glycosyltransferase family 2 protein [Xanthobacter autotrophicus]|uniref:glycosyltransferase family 2 protein n=1 Tax=Xanthobacter autotrophicus TaxID=280 RepID=UPI0024A724C3|nr:glycosyltransferase family 2 protein [Xanthobacter autotrophicus]MDI4658558.1 glycosyltransferase family 2 protein [Xanthobacter autotrophicus]
MPVSQDDSTLPKQSGPGSERPGSSSAPIPPEATCSDFAAPELTVIVVSYNTAALTLAALRTLYAQTTRTRFHCVVWDNNSTDGSVEAVAREFPQAELVASKDNLGFARANNVVAERATTPWLLLLNPDTEVHDSAVDRLMDFARAHPQAGIWGGRTVFPDGSPNIASCWGKITPWSVACLALGLSAAFSKSEFFNPEAYGGWQRDTVREVDIVVGCFLLIRRELWNKLGGFNLKYYMYGEEADLCLRAKAEGWRPMIDPDAEIMHIVGASAGRASNKAVQVLKARTTLIRDHWSPAMVPFGLATIWFGYGLRWLVTRPFALAPTPGLQAKAKRWSDIWSARRNWLAGYP